MKPRNLLFVLTLAACAGGCWYQPMEEYENPIEPISANKFKISLNDINNTDTIKLLGPTTFSYVLSGSTSGNTKAKVTLGTRQLASTADPPNGAFEIRGTDLKTGVYDLKVEITTGSGSGSLADSRGEERVTVLGQWVVMIFVDLPSQPVFTQSVVNGYQVISWAPYTGKYFTSYKLETSYNSKPGKTLMFTNKSIASWTDSTFSGNTAARYTLTITNQVGSATGSLPVARDAITLTTSFSQGDSIATIEFNTPKYPPAISHYVVLEGDVERMQISDISQATASFKLNDVGYGYTPTIKLRRIPKPAGQETTETSKQVVVTIPTKKLHLPIQELFFNEDLNAFYGYRDLGSVGQLVSYDSSTFAARDSVEIFDTPSIDIPYKGQNAYFLRSGQIVQLNLITKAEKSFTPITSGAGLQHIIGASNEYVSYQWYTTSISNARTHRFAVYNMATNTAVVTLSSLPGNTTTPPGFGYVSDDGKYYRDYGKFIHSLDPADLNIGQHTGVWQGFRDDKSDEFLVGISDISIYNANTLTLKKTVSAQGATYEGYDVAARKLIFNDNISKKVYAVDIDTNEMTTHKVNATNFIVANGFLITKSGEYFRIYR
ncbi:MAG TPA: hypothetical protein VFE50_00155 [Cyclobacteriaceae bacterium]|nr:hypothetical protein [Cyclobacteriaceae bacterium]